MERMLRGTAPVNIFPENTEGAARMKVPSSGSGLPAFSLRTAALFILLYHIRLFAADLADTLFFAAALAGASGAALFLNRKKINGRPVRPFQALIILALIPWAIRFFIALPRWFIPGAAGRGAVILDSLLLNLDRNNFAALLPFYWTAFTSYFSRRSRAFLRADIPAADLLFLVMAGAAPQALTDAYRWPVLMIGVFALVLFLQFFALVLSTAPELKLRRKEGAVAGVFLFLLVVSVSALFIRPFQEKAVEQGGGLLEPDLFRFDFSQVLRLESEISVNDDLVLIVKKDPDGGRALLRRYTLSGYGRKQGFFRLDDVDEAAHPQYLPGRPVTLPAAGIRNFSVTDQEYYIVNFDASAFTGMNMPVRITPFETWDASSFNSAYAVRSHVSGAAPYELMDAVQGPPGPENLGMDTAGYALYTDYGGDAEIAAFAREIIQEASPVRLRGGPDASPSYWEQIQMVYDRLKYGEYRYSLRPGIAPDGDQLKYFLFTARKGYCSYYAFAFTLLLRSLGIPSRVAAGFSADLSTGAFGYYPVRADMAHAWVEVWFPGYGWIEYDPTSEEIAEGEEYRFSGGTPPELFERLMKEILENRSRLKTKEGEDGETGEGGPGGSGERAVRFLTEKGPSAAVAAFLLLFLALRSGFFLLSVCNGNPRKKTLFLWRHARRRLALAGLGVSPVLGEAEWAKTLDASFGGLYLLYLDSAAARFAPEPDLRQAAGHYRLFSGGYRKALPAWRRLLAWVFPPLALILPPPRGLGRGGSAGKTVRTLLPLILLFLLRGGTGQAQDGYAGADTLYGDALAAQGAENWEKAIELLSAGAGEYPLDSRFPWALGDLYYGRSLYRLAWDEYRRTEKITAADPELLYLLANTAGYLNMNGVSAEYLEKLLVLEPYNREAAGNLAWMYFKLHRLRQGERVLLKTIEDSGEDADLSMTLGTIYSGMFRYRESKEAYLKSVHAAEEDGDWLFAALANYNLSILESRFYQYSLAYDRTNDSLRGMDRASGRLARGEIYLRRMELPPALAEYRDAYGMDSSPLSKLNLAAVFQTGGRLTEAALYAGDCLKASDQSWMMNYGTDPVRYKQDIHEILKDAYGGLFKAETFAAPDGLKEKVRGFFRALSYRFRGEVHLHLFRKYSLLAAGAFRSGSGGPGMDGIHLEALLLYSGAFGAYPGRALAYLRNARALEEPVIPESAPSYGFEEALLLKDRGKMQAALDGFDPLWERDMIARVYAELAKTGSRAGRADAAERLFALNRGALLQNGIRLPVELRIGAGAARAGGALEKAVKAAGIDPSGGTGPERGGPRYTLTIAAAGEGLVSCTLYDGGRGIELFRQDLPFPGTTASSRAAFSRALRDGVFNAF